MPTKRQLLTGVAVALLFTPLLGACSNEAAAPGHSTALADAMNSPARTPSNIQRDKYRNPQATLEFFEVAPHHTVVEIWPGGGWYSEILAPYLHQHGQLYAAGFATSDERGFAIRARANYAERVANDALFGNVIITEFSPLENSAIAPPASADRVLTFRNLHNWYMASGEAGIKGAFATFYQALKPGGMLGIVDHRLPETRPDSDMESSGYIKESYTIALAEAAGFELVARSEINANPNDTTEHPRGVWTLPPTLAAGDQDRDKYIEIGESDRFTLKFVKPHN